MCLRRSDTATHSHSYLLTIKSIHMLVYKYLMGIFISITMMVIALFILYSIFYYIKNLFKK